jgi:hypothetical protein
MVRDNVTGLIWEVKQAKDGVKDYSNPHDADNTYTWYDSNSATNGGNAGTSGDGTDTEDFINALNAAAFGGFSDWRMPSVKELSSLINNDIPYPGPTIDATWFPRTGASGYWSSTTYAAFTSIAWRVNFSYGSVPSNAKSNIYYVRAVRTEQ